MKRVNNLYEKLISDENLLKAIEEVSNTHKWIQYPSKPNQIAFWLGGTKNERVIELRKMIEKGFIPSSSIHKKRYDTNAQKWRDIYEPKLWPDQCIHHAIVQILEPVMMRGMDKWCCGSIRNRGTHYGIKAIKKWMKNDIKGTSWCVELDIKHFYENLNPYVVMNRLKELIKDYRTLDLIWRVIKDGIQIGAYCSQWFANTTLQPLDHLIRQQKGVAHYVRYMDNFTIFCQTKEAADEVINLVSIWLKDHKMELKSNWQKFKIDEEMPKDGKKRRYPNALGYKFGRNFTLLRKHTLLRLRRQLKIYYVMLDQNECVTPKFALSLLSRLGMLRHCNSSSIYRAMRPKTQKRLKNVIRMIQRQMAREWKKYISEHNSFDSIKILSDTKFHL